MCHISALCLSGNNHFSTHLVMEKESLSVLGFYILYQDTKLLWSLPGFMFFYRCLNLTSGVQKHTADSTLSLFFKQKQNQYGKVESALSASIEFNG